MFHQTPKKLTKHLAHHSFKKGIWKYINLALFIWLAFTTQVIADSSNEEPSEYQELLSTLPKFHKLKIIETTLELSSDDTYIPIVQLKLSLMAENPEDIVLAKYHEPLYRAAIILYLNKLTKYDLTTYNQKQKLKLELLKLINSNIYKETNRPNVVKRVLITKMVIE